MQRERDLRWTDLIERFTEFSLPGASPLHGCGVVCRVDERSGGASDWCSGSVRAVEPPAPRIGGGGALRLSLSECPQREGGDASSDARHVGAYRVPEEKTVQMKVRGRGLGALRPAPIRRSEWEPVVCAFRRIII